jgi:hypothetical protein
MADIKTTALPVTTTPVSADILYLVDGGTSSQVTVGNLLGQADDINTSLVTLTGTQTLTNKTLTAPTISAPIITGTTTLSTALTGVLRADSGVVATDSDVTDLVGAASTTTAGKVELTVASEVTTGTSTTLAITPDSLAGSNYGIKYISVVVFATDTDVAIGDGKAFFHIPPGVNGMNLVYAHGAVYTAGTTNSTTVQVHNLTQTADMLTALIEIETTEVGSDTSDPGVTIDTANDDVATNDRIRIDVDSVSTTAPLGLVITLGFQLP